MRRFILHRLLQAAVLLIGVSIIGFALMQAWRMNPKVQLPISGPFQVSGASGPLTESPAHA